MFAMKSNTIVKIANEPTNNLFSSADTIVEWTKKIAVPSSITFMTTKNTQVATISGLDILTPLFLEPK